MTEILKEKILDWYDSQIKPNVWRDYFACPVCGATWRETGIEHHRKDCWIPPFRGDVNGKQK